VVQQCLHKCGGLGVGKFCTTSHFNVFNCGTKEQDLIEIQRGHVLMNPLNYSVCVTQFTLHLFLFFLTFFCNLPHPEVQTSGDGTHRPLTQKQIGPLYNLPNWSLSQLFFYCHTFFVPLSFFLSKKNVKIYLAKWKCGGRSDDWMNEWVLTATCKHLVWSTRIGRSVPIWILRLIPGSGLRGAVLPLGVMRSGVGKPVLDRIPSPEVILYTAYSLLNYLNI